MFFLQSYYVFAVSLISQEIVQFVYFQSASIRSRRIDVIFSTTAYASLLYTLPLNNIKFLKQDEYLSLCTASDVYFSYEMLCMFARG